MPELPEVETMVRGLRPHVLGRTILSVSLCPHDCKPITLQPSLARQRRQLLGKQFLEVSRLGKRVVFHVSEGSHLVIEPRMTGLMLLSDPPDLSHLRLKWEFAGESEFSSLWFWDRRGLGTVTLYAPGQLAEKYHPQSLGPDALEMTAEDWVVRCRKTEREIKVVIMDQKMVAGIGNLYASEILHQAKLNPTSPAKSLSQKSCEKLTESMRVVLLNAIECEGSTLGDGTYRNALNQNGSYQNQHRVYMKEGLICPSCHQDSILRIVQAQRSTFFCPTCQPT